MPSRNGRARSGRAGLSRRLALIALMFSVLLAAMLAGLYAAWPWLVAAAAPRLAPALGLDTLHVTVGRPGPAGMPVRSVDLTSGRLRVSASHGRITYRPMRLLTGRMETVTFRRAEVEVTSPPIADAAPDAADHATAAGEAAAPAELPEVAALFAALPAELVSVETLELQVPELDFRAAGTLRITHEGLEAHADALAPPRAERFALDLALSASGELEARLGERPAADGTAADATAGANVSSPTPVLLVRSTLTGRSIELNGDLDLTGFPLELAAAVAGVPPGGGSVSGRFSGTLPWPLPTDADWAAIEAEGRFGVNWRPRSGSWAIADGVADWRLDQGTLAGTATGRFRHDGRTLLVRADADAVDPDGTRGRGNLQLTEPGDDAGRLTLNWELAPEHVALQASFEVSERSLAWLPAETQPPPGRGVVSGNLSTRLSRPLRPAEQWQNAVPTAQATLRGYWHLRDEPLRVDDVRADWRLDHGRVAGTVNAHVTHQNLTAAVGVELDALQLHGAALAVDGTAALGGGELQVPFSLRHDLDAGAGRLDAEMQTTFDAPLLTALLDGWKEPYDLNAGSLAMQAAVHWPAAQTLAGSVHVTLEGVDAGYDDYRLYGLRSELHLGTGTDGAWRLAPADLQVARIDTGVELTEVRTRVAWFGDTVTVDGIAAALLGGAANVDTFAYSLAAGEADLIARLTDLELGQILALEGEHISGTGILNGTLPVQVRGNEIGIVAGEVRAEPPGGVIRVSPALAGGTGQPGLDFALRALADFRYSVLEADVAYTGAGDLTLAVRLQGRNPAIEEGRPIHYNLNVTENVPTLLRSLRLQDDVTRQIERRMTD